MATDKLVDFDHVTDYISREAALACFHDWIDRYGHEHSADEMAEYQRIEDLPDADVVEVRHGRWEHNDDGYGCENLWWCSACKKEFVLIEGTPCDNGYYYCPNCGADMREPNLDTTKGERRDESSG